MPKFRKKPIVIEAMLFDGSWQSASPILTWMDDGDATWSGDQTIVIPTLEGDMTAGAGDWIIKGLRGEFYPCKPDIFAATYDLVDE